MYGFSGSISALAVKNDFLFYTLHLSFVGIILSKIVTKEAAIEKFKNIELYPICLIYLKLFKAGDRVHFKN